MKMIYGKEQGTPVPVTKAWISKWLWKYVEEDRFGVYRKKNIIIPFYCRLEYNMHKKNRELMIISYYEKIENLTDLDKMKKEELLRMG